jgi:hypothetical protein
MSRATYFVGTADPPQTADPLDGGHHLRYGPITDAAIGQPRMAALLEPRHLDRISIVAYLVG